MRPWKVIKRRLRRTWANSKLLRLQGLRLHGRRLSVRFSHSLPDHRPNFLIIPVRRSLADVEKSQAEAVVERNAAEQQLQSADKKIRDLEAKLDEEGRESSDLGTLHQCLSEELEDERKQHLKDLADRDFTTDQTRKKYQG